MNLKIFDTDIRNLMNQVFILTGSNLGNREENLAVASELINRQCGTVINTSSIYETAAWGKTDQPGFLNQALELETSLNAKQLIRRVLKVEKKMGRIRKEKFDPRIIDIDILLFNSAVYNFDFLTIPHPELHNRRFALIPLAELAKEVIHPVFNKTISALLEKCADKLEVKKYQ